MPFQTTVNASMGAGVVGEVFNDGPRRAQTYTLDTTNPVNNVFGRAFTKSAVEGFAQAGNGGPNGFAGILIAPKSSALFGNLTDGSLGPSLTLPDNALGEIMSMGSAWVNLPAPADIGDYVVYDNTTGALSTIAPGATLPAGTSFAYALVDYFQVTAAGLAVITLTPSLTPPSA